MQPGREIAVNAASKQDGTQSLHARCASPGSQKTCRKRGFHHMKAEDWKTGVTGQGMQSARREHAGKIVLSPLPMSPADSLIMAREASQSETTR